MSMVKLIYRNEVRLLCRNPYMALPFAVQLICWGFVIFPYEKQPVRYEETAAVFYNNFQWIMLVNLLLAGLVAVYMASKHRESEFELLASTYKVKNTEWIAGLWLVAQMYALGLAALLLLIQGIWFLSGSMGMEERLHNLLYVFVQMEGAALLIVSFGFLLGIWIRNMLSYICMVALLGVVFLIQANSYGFAYVNPRLNLLAPYDSMYIATPYESIWGINGVFAGAMLHQLAVVLAGVIVLAAALLLYRPHRRLKPEKIGLLAMAVIAAVPAVIAGGIRYAQYDSALEQYLADGKQYLFASFEESGTFFSSQEEGPHYPFSMDRAQLNVQFPSDNRIEVDSRLSVTYRGAEPVHHVSLTLQHELGITECSGSVDIACSRERDFIRIHVPNGIQPNERLQFHLKYEGNVKQYRSDGLRQQSFFESGRVYLPKEAGWYPLIGERVLAGSFPDYTYVKFEMRTEWLIEDYPTEFTVAIKGGDPEMPMALTIPRQPDGSYKGISTYGLSLIGGNFKEVTVGQTRLVAHPDVVSGTRQTTELYSEYWSYLEKWLGVPAAPKVIYILDKGRHSPYPSMPSREFIAWTVYDIKFAEPSVMVYSLAYHLIPKNPPEGDDVHLLKRAITWGLMKHLRMESGFNRFGDWYANDWPFDMPAETTGKIDLLNRYEELGEEPFRQIVKYMFNEYEGLEDKAKFNLEEALNKYEGEAVR